MFNIFLALTITGALIGLFFDVFRILRKTIKTTNIMTYIEDIMFWIFTSFLIFIVINKLNLR